MIDSAEVMQVLSACAAEPASADATTIEGVINTFALSRAELEKHRLAVRGWIDQLVPEFMEGHGGGWTFLNLCDCRDGQWTGFHRDQEALFVLAKGLGLADFLMPRDLWSVLPGGMPYVVFRTEPQPARAA